MPSSADLSLINTNMGKIKTYVGTDGKLHFVNSGGADSVLNFSSGFKYTDIKTASASTSVWASGGANGSGSVGIPSNRYLLGYCRGSASYGGTSANVTLPSCSPGGSSISFYLYNYNSTGYAFNVTITYAYIDRV